MEVNESAFLHCHFRGSFLEVLNPVLKNVVNYIVLYDKFVGYDNNIIRIPL